MGSTERVAGLQGGIAHGRPANDVVGLFLLLVETLDRGVGLFLLVVALLVPVPVGGWRDNGKLQAIAFDRLEGAVGDELVVLEFVAVFGLGIENLYFGPGNGGVLIVSFSVDVEPLAGEGEVHLLLGDLAGLVVVERVRIFVPRACIYLEERLFLSLLK